MNKLLLGNFQSVIQFEGKNGAVKNQFLIYTDKGVVFQSYDSIIAANIVENGKPITLLDKRYWDYSRTTGKYRNIFLGETKADTEWGIKHNKYFLRDLN